jgi:hypothetical protein
MSLKSSINTDSNNLNQSGTYAIGNNNNNIGDLTDRSNY